MKVVGLVGECAENVNGTWNEFFIGKISISAFNDMLNEFVVQEIAKKSLIWLLDDNKNNNNDDNDDNDKD